MAIRVEYGNGGAALGLMYQGVKKQAGAAADEQFINQVQKQRQDMASNYAQSIQQALTADKIQADANLQMKQQTSQDMERQQRDELAAQTAAADRAANNQRLALAQRDQGMQEARFASDQQDRTTKKAAFDTLTPDDQKRVMFGPAVFDPTKAPDTKETEMQVKATADRIGVLNTRLKALSEKNPDYVADPIMRQAMGSKNPAILTAAPTRIRPDALAESKSISDEVSQLLAHHGQLSAKLSGGGQGGAAAPGGGQTPGAQAPRPTTGVTMMVGEKIANIQAPPAELAAPTPGANLRSAPEKMAGLKDFMLQQLKNQDPIFVRRISMGTATQQDYQALDQGFIKLARGQGWSF